MVYSSCINIVAKWYPEKKGWRTGFVNGGWAYGAGAVHPGHRRVQHRGRVPVMSAGSLKTYIWVQAIIMTVGITLAGLFMKDPPKNWWPKEIDPLNWHKHGTRDLRSNPPALRHYNGGEMWRTPQAKWTRHPVRPVHRCSLFGRVAGARSSWLGSVRWCCPSRFSRRRHPPVYGYRHRRPSERGLRLLGQRRLPGRPRRGRSELALADRGDMSGGLVRRQLPMTAAWWPTTTAALRLNALSSPRVDDAAAGRTPLVVLPCGTWRSLGSRSHPAPFDSAPPCPRCSR